MTEKAGPEKAGPEKAVEQPAVEQSPENVPEAIGEPGVEIRAVGERQGMFGVRGTGDTSGFGGLVAPVVLPGVAQRPFGGWFDTVADTLDPLIESVVIHRGEITFHVHRDNLLAVARLVRDDPALRFEFLSGVSAVHYPGDAGRELHAVYHFMSYTWNRRIRVEVSAPDGDAHVARRGPPGAGRPGVALRVPLRRERGALPR
ncbi:hypothetical protein ASD84_00030 [Nocardioides sp. Root682]|nr:hypothetical protein ASD84_00030 [Nocardioides sp. Root682]